MTTPRSIPGMEGIWGKSLGDPRICIAILDGPVDLAHPCFAGADLVRLESHWSDGHQVIPEAILHATHICSLILGQHGSNAEGIAPRCRGINIPVIYDPASMLEPVALAHAIDLAFREGADIIHIASCIPTRSGAVHDLVARAIQRCLDNNVLVIAPAGNDKGGCFCVPAIIPGVLAVGACDDEGRPADFTNYGGIYDQQGLLAPGVGIVAAAPGGGVESHKGTSCSAPIVTGIAALLMSIGLANGWPVNGRLVREAILRGTAPCNAVDAEERRRCMRGLLDIPGALRQFYGLTGEQRRATRGQHLTTADRGASGVRPRRFRRVQFPPDPAASRSALRQQQSNGVSPSSCECEGSKGLVFFIGLVGYDFGTEARRDTFKQQMRPVLYRRSGAGDAFEYPATDQARNDLLGEGFIEVPPNPYDARQMVAYLRSRPSEARSLIWTLNLELTPVYVVEPVGPFAATVYGELLEMLAGQSQGEDSQDYVERVSIPAELTDSSVRLFSGQEATAILVDAPRGMYAWKTTDLLTRMGGQLEAALAEAKRRNLIPGPMPTPRDYVMLVLNKLYYEYRNVGVTSADRALNWAATNIFMITNALLTTIAEGKTLERIDVVESPFCRVDSDCWDVQLKFLDPENTSRAYTVLRFSVDVSDRLPVTLGKLVSYISAS